MSVLIEGGLLVVLGKMVSFDVCARLFMMSMGWVESRMSM